MITLVEQTRELLHAVRGSLIKVAQNLAVIKESDVYKAGEWGAFCETELNISESFASKLLTVNRVYLVEGGLSPEKLEGVDYEKLYLARNLEGPAELRLEKARTLSRSDLRVEQVEDGHVHSGETVTIHKCCGMRVE